MARISGLPVANLAASRTALLAQNVEEALTMNSWWGYAGVWYHAQVAAMSAAAI